MKRRRALLLSITVVLALCAACGWWLHRERQQYVLNRQLIEALLRNDTKTALALINEGANPNTRQEPPPAPSLKLLLNRFLHHTSAPANDSPTAFIIACGPRLFLNSSGNTTWGRPPHYPDEDVELVQAMLRHRADVHARYMQEYTALFGAVEDDRMRTVEVLVQHDADVNALLEGGYTPLMLAANSDAFNVIRLLLAHGANPNVQNEDGETALHIAVHFDASDGVIPELLAHGANPKLRDKDGETPLEKAQGRNFSDLVRLLKRGAK